jgi:hypothetical protein
MRNVEFLDAESAGESRYDSEGSLVEVARDRHHQILRRRATSDINVNDSVDGVSRQVY